MRTDPPLRTFLRTFVSANGGAIFSAGSEMRREAPRKIQCRASQRQLLVNNNNLNAGPGPAWFLLAPSCSFVLAVAGFCRREERQGKQEVNQLHRGTKAEATAARSAAKKWTSLRTSREAEQSTSRKAKQIASEKQIPSEKQIASSKQSTTMYVDEANKARRLSAWRRRRSSAASSQGLYCAKGCKLQGSLCR